MKYVKIKADGDLFKTINETFDSIFPFANASAYSKTSISPRTEITEDKDNFYLNMEIPGVSKENVKIGIENNVLTVSGEKKENYNKEEKTVVLNERFYGQFSRSFNISKDVKVNDIQAEFKDGVLNITLPKLEEAKPVVKEVTIK